MLMSSLLTVTTPATDRALLTPAQSRQAVGNTDSSQDEALIRLGTLVSGAIYTECNIAAAGTSPPTAPKRSSSTRPLR